MSDGALPSSTFCVLPWLSVATSPSGSLRICCNSGMHQLQDENGRTHKIYRTDTLTDAWNSPLMKQTRLQMLRGESPKICFKCRREEDAGLKSMRHGFNERWSHLVQELAQATAEDGSAPLRLKYLDLRLGNLCNLRCRTCSPYSSNQLVKEWVELFPGRLNRQEETFLSEMDWFESERLWALLCRNVHEIEEIYMSGGESLLVKSQRRLFELCVREGHAKRIRLRFNTNVTHLPDDLLDYWRHFEAVQINCSVDGIGELNEYIRFPSKWKIVESNLKKLARLAKEHPVFTIEIHTTVQAYNVLYLDQVIDYFRDPEFESITRFPFMNLLDSPAHMNVRVLPAAVKRRAAERLAARARSARDQDKLRLEGVIRYMEEEDWSAQLPEFMRVTRHFDAGRAQKFAQVVPELAAFLNE